MIDWVKENTYLNDAQIKYFVSWAFGTEAFPSDFIEVWNARHSHYQRIYGKKNRTLALRKMLDIFYFLKTEHIKALSDCNNK